MDEGSIEFPHIDIIGEPFEKEDPISPKTQQILKVDLQRPIPIDEYYIYSDHIPKLEFPDFDMNAYVD
jgi:hypothetical protein